MVLRTVVPVFVVNTRFEKHITLTYYMTKRNNKSSFIPTLINKNMNLKLDSKKLSKEDLNRILKSKDGFNREMSKSVMNVATKIATTLLEYKLGNNYIKTSNAINNILTGGKSDSVVTANRNTSIRNNKTTTKFAYVQINGMPKGRFSKVPAFHRRNSVMLMNTETDFVTEDKRLQLCKGVGLNQKSILFLNRESYLTYDDVKSIVDYDNNVKFFKKKQASEASRLSDKNDKLRIRNADFITNKTISSVVNRLSTKLSITNDGKAYTTYINVHICMLRDPKNASILEEMVRDIERHTLEPSRKSLKVQDIIRNSYDIKRRLWPDFMQQMLVSPKSNVMKTEAIKNNLTVVRTLRRSLGPSDRLKIKINQNFTRGVNLNLMGDVMNGELPFGCFIIIESVGQDNAIIQDRETLVRRSGTAPHELRLTMETKLHYICSDITPDVPITIVDQEEIDDFEDPSISEEWFPDRTSEFNVDYKNIDMDGNNIKSKYKLQYDTETAVVVQSSPDVDNINKYLKNIDLGSEIEDFNEDDLSVIGKNSTNTRQAAKTLLEAIQDGTLGDDDDDTDKDMKDIFGEEI